MNYNTYYKKSKTEIASQPYLNTVIGNGEKKRLKILTFEGTE